MSKNEERSHHIIENKGSRFGTNPTTNPPKPNFDPLMMVYDEQNKRHARGWVHRKKDNLFNLKKLRAIRKRELGTHESEATIRQRHSGRHP